MPLTIAHPAAVVPIKRALGGWCALSALVIGSMVPDFAYFLPVGVSRTVSHSSGALIWFCLPVGCATYVIFHLLLKEPLLSLVPALAHRLSITRPELRRLPDTSWVVVASSVLLGAVSHLAWDSFTHDGAPGVQAVPLLELELFSVGGYQVFVYKILQHGSTLLGLGCLAWWLLSWWQMNDRNSGSIPRLTLSRWVIAVLILAGIPVVAGLVSFLTNLSWPLSVRTLPLAVGNGVKSFFTGVGVGMLLFAVLWRIWFSTSEPYDEPATRRSI